MMSRGMRLPGAMLVLVCSVLAQDNPAKKFAGTWEASFKGAVFATLKIQVDDKITGSMSVGNIEVDDEGNLRSASAGDSESRILKPSLENEILTFELTDDPNDEPLKFELKITGGHEAQLRFLKTPGDLKIKPLTFTKSE